MKLRFFLMAALLAAALNIQAAPGDLDAAFGAGGKTVYESINGLGVLPTRAALQADGKIIYAGNFNAGLTIEMIVARFNADGSIDASFGTAGVARIAFGDLLAAATSVVVQPDNKIIVAGLTSRNFGNDLDFAAARLTASGALDPTFDGDGRLTTSFDGNLFEAAFAAALQPDGKILLAGGRQNAATEESWFAVARYTANGALDASFSDDGKFFAKVGAGGEKINIAAGVAVQPDGKILIAGENSSDSSASFAVMRLTAGGALDPAFDDDGRVQTVVAGFGEEKANAVAVQPDGKILLAGHADVDAASGGGNDDFAVVRYNADGSLDAGFSDDGKATFSFGGSRIFEQANDVLVEPNGKILVGGFSGNVTADETITADFALLKLGADGAPDPQFGAGGFVKTNLGAAIGFGYRLLLQPDGKILLAGAAGEEALDEADFSPAFARYQNEPPIARKAPFDFDGDNKTDISVFRPASGEWWINRSSSAQTIAAQFGAATDKLVPGDFTGDGRADIAFWRPSSGFWYILRSEDASFFSFPFGTAGDVPLAGDFDADGKSDPAVFRPSTNEWFISKSSGGTLIKTFGAAGDVPVAADYDGDGKADVGVYRPSTGEWWISRSTNGSVYAFQFGTSTDKPVQGDYTGDGRADPAFFRPSTGEWFILRSEDSSYYSVPFGANGDQPAPGDYDGDGRFDPAVFRAASGTWYVQRTTAGTMIQSFGLAGDRAVANAFVP